MIWFRNMDATKISGDDTEATRYRTVSDFAESFLAAYTKTRGRYTLRHERLQVLGLTTLMGNLRSPTDGNIGHKNIERLSMKKVYDQFFNKATTEWAYWSWGDWLDRQLEP